VTQPRRRPQLTPPALALSVALAVTVGLVIYLAVTSLPYLASSPAGDPTFGALNQCLLSSAPQRVGFAVGRDARRISAWTNDAVVECAEGQPPRTWPLKGVTVGAYDGRARLWVAARGADAGLSGLFLLGSGVRHVGPLMPQALVGVHDGVVALEPSGRLVSVLEDGSVSGSAELPSAEGAVLTSSGDGTRVAVSVGGGFFAFDAQTLKVLRAEAPCRVQRLWWKKAGHRVLVTCGPDETWALEVDVDTGQAETAGAHPRAPSVLAGPDGPWVQPCDMLPCTADEPS
jgi:hypothetical protein